MPRIRNLHYNNNIVEQPYYNNIPLKRWVHDNVIVWENGGISNIYVGIIGYNHYFVDVKEKTIVSTIIANRENIGYTNDYVWKSAWDGSRLNVYEDAIKAIPITLSQVMAVRYGMDNKFLATNSASNIVFVEIENYGTNILNEINMADLLGRTVNTFLEDIGGSKNNIGVVVVSHIPRVGTGYEYNYVDYISTDGKVTNIFEGYTGYRVADGSDTVAFNADSYNVNGKRIFFGNHSLYKWGAYDDNKTYIVVIDKEEITICERPPIYEVQITEERTALKTIMFDDSKKRMVGYYSFDNGLQKIIVFNNNFESAEQITLPEYIDVPVEQPANHTHIRLWFKAIGETPDGYLSVYACAQLSRKSTWYGDNGIEDAQTLLLPISNRSGNYIVYIDNLYFNETENNFAIAV